MRGMSGEGGAGAGQNHDHSNCEECLMGDNQSLFKYIALQNVRCLNERISGSAQRCFRPYHDRYENVEFVESDVDDSLLIHIPFIANVVLKSIVLITDDMSTSPMTMKIFINRDDMDFHSAEDSPCTQEWSVSPDKRELEFNTKISKFQSVYSVNLYFPKSFGEDKIAIRYVGLHGEFKEIRSKFALNAVYELRANPADHKLSLNSSLSHDIN